MSCSENRSGPTRAQIPGVWWVVPRKLRRGRSSRWSGRLQAQASAFVFSPCDKLNWNSRTCSASKVMNDHISFHEIDGTNPLDQNGGWKTGCKSSRIKNHGADAAAFEQGSNVPPSRLSLHLISCRKLLVPYVSQKVWVWLKLTTISHITWTTWTEMIIHAKM